MFYSNFHPCCSFKRSPHAVGKKIDDFKSTNYYHDIINLDQDNNKMVFVKKDFIMELIALIRVNTGEKNLHPI